MTPTAHTLGRNPSRGPAVTKTLTAVCDELNVLTGNRYRTRIAVVLPPERVITHDDEQCRTRRQFIVADSRELHEFQQRNPRARFLTIGAVVFPCTWSRFECVPRHLPTPEGDQPWILIKPEFMSDPNIVARFREAAAADQEWWSTKGKAISMESIEEEAMDEDARRTKARKAAATRKRNAKAKATTSREHLTPQES